VTASLFACLLVLLGAPDSVSDLRAVLRKHEKDPYEQFERARAIRSLGRIGTIESTQALEGCLEDPFAHIRDEAVSGLIQLKRVDASPRAKSIEMLGDYLRRRRNPETRRHLATALGLIGDRAAVPALLKALKREKDETTTQAIVTALVRLKDERCVGELATKARVSKSARAACVRGLGHFAGGGETVLAYQDDPSDAVRAALIDALVQRRRPILPDLELDDRLGPLAGMALADALPRHRDSALARRRAAFLLRHPSWRVRAAAVDGVTALRDPTLLGDLVDLLAGTGRLRHDAWVALRNLTGRAIPPDPEQWRAILPFAELPVKVDDGVSPETTTTAYFGLPVYSERIAFVFDVSGSMRDDRKIELSRERFADTVKALEAEQRYDLFVYRYLLDYPPRPKLERAFGKLVSGKAETAIRWLDRQEAKGGGAIFDALVAAMDDEEVDTIYLLSDGVPSYGTVARDFRVLQEVRRHNRWRRVVIHTILLGTKGTDRKFMAALAGATGGRAVDADGRSLR
jgi:HEAT repeat protein